MTSFEQQVDEETVATGWALTMIEYFADGSTYGGKHATDSWDNHLTTIYS